VYRAQLNALTERRAAQTVVRLIELGHWIGWLTLAGGCLVIASYALELQLIRRPISEGAATHPLTAALFVICGLAIVAMRAVRTPGSPAAPPDAAGKNGQAPSRAR
jgi:hypothetical protein